MSPSLEEERSALLRVVSELYAHDHLGEGEMTRRMEAIASAPSLEALRAQAETMEGPGELFLQTSLIERPPQRISGNGSSIRKKGTWLESRRVELSGSGSSIRLDLSSYADGKGISLELDFDLQRSSVIVFVPRSFRVLNSLEEASASTVKTSGREDPAARNTIVARGSVQASFVKFVLR